MNLHSCKRLKHALDDQRHIKEVRDVTGFYVVMKKEQNVRAKKAERERRDRQRENMRGTGDSDHIHTPAQVALLVPASTNVTLLRTWKSTLEQQSQRE